MNLAPGLLSILNGLVGDKLVLFKRSWAIPMRFRDSGKDLSEAELSKTLSGNKALIVFVHGLMADESIWDTLSKPLKKRFNLAYLRYNTGLHISENGQKLSQHLSQLGDLLPNVPIILVGHSMGGLVIRSACHYGRLKKQSWIKRVKVVFLIAVPNAGASLAKLGHLTTYLLKKLSLWHIRKLGNLLEHRSAGIKDLSLAYMTDEDWKQAKHPRTSIPTLPGVSYHILVGSLSKDESSLMTKYFGDGLVTPDSATSKTMIKIATVKTFPKAGHNSLLKDKRVANYLFETLKGYS